MGRTIYIPTLNDTTDFASDTINAIPQESTVDTFAGLVFKNLSSLFCNPLRHNYFLKFIQTKVYFTISTF